MANFKKHTKSTIIGQKGVNLIEKIVLDMGFVWNPTTIDAGIDGFIEIRDETTDEATNFIIQVQSKATEKDFILNRFNQIEYICEERDIDYWLKGNSPVILVYTNTKIQQSYWISLKEYFSDQAKRKSKKILFEKSNRFTIDSKNDILNLAVPKDKGHYFTPLPKHEKIYPNLLKIKKFPYLIYCAETNFRNRRDFWENLNNIPEKNGINKAWILQDKFIYTFNNLNEKPWCEVFKDAEIKTINSSDWANSNDINVKRNFVALLKSTFESYVFSKRIIRKVVDRIDLFYFKPIMTYTNLPKTTEKVYNRFGRQSKLTICDSYARKSDPKIISYYRHLAFETNYLRINQGWYIEITPTYLFTHDGFKLHTYYESKLKGKKALDYPETVFSEFLFWVHCLLETTELFGNKLLEFDGLISLDIHVGIDDKKWSEKEDIDVSNDEELNLFVNHEN